MNQGLVELWADIGSEIYWEDLVTRYRVDFVPFAERWPQPGFVGENYFDAERRVLVMGQNPRAGNTSRASDSDREMFRLIRRHCERRTTDSLRDLFSMVEEFMLGTAPYKPAWRPITAARNHLGLQLNSIAYLNLIPLATRGDLILPAFRGAFERSTKKQLALLQPAKLVLYGKGAYDQFIELAGRSPNARYIGQRDYSLAPSVRQWLSGNEAG